MRERKGERDMIQTRVEEETDNNENKQEHRKTGEIRNHN
jgi:hypothetical protein